ASESWRPAGRDPSPGGPFLRVAAGQWEEAAVPLHPPRRRAVRLRGAVGGVGGGGRPVPLRLANGGGDEASRLIVEVRGQGIVGQGPHESFEGGPSHRERTACVRALATPVRRLATLLPRSFKQEDDRIPVQFAVQRLPPMTPARTSRPAPRNLD